MKLNITKTLLLFAATLFSFMFEAPNADAARPNVNHFMTYLNEVARYSSPYSSARACSPKEYYRLRPDVARSSGQFGQRNGPIGAIKHFYFHGDSEGMCNPTGYRCTAQRYLTIRRDVARAYGININRMTREDVYATQVHWWLYGWARGDSRGMCYPTF